MPGVGLGEQAEAFQIISAIFDVLLEVVHGYGFSFR
jgi:hypothetical protein